MGVRAGAVGLVLQALDGTKIELDASGYSGWSKQYMDKLLAALDATLDQTELALAQEKNQLCTSNAARSSNDALVKLNNTTVFDDGPSGDWKP